MRRAALTLAVAIAAPGCAVGDGSGEVRSDALTAPGCYRGPFSLEPTFFAASPYRSSIAIRVQHGEAATEVSDGLAVLVDDAAWVRARLGQPLRVGPPVGVRPAGTPVTYDPDPPRVHATLYLHASCHQQNVALEVVGGHMTFNALFDGDPQTARAEDRMTEAVFDDLVVADPRALDPTAATPAVGADATSVLYGNFRFAFRRGQSAQPFQ